MTKLNDFKVTKRILHKLDNTTEIFFRDVRKLKPISEREESELIQKVKNNNDHKAYNKLIESNMRFVISVAKQYQGKGIELCDLIQEGSLGLMHAIDKFDPDKGCKFVTYAVYWIRQYIIKSLQCHSRTIRLPQNQLSNYAKIKNETEKFEQENDRSPSTLELEENTGIEHDKIYSIMASSINTTSFDRTVDESECLPMVELIPNENADLVEETVENIDMKNKINSVLNKLSNRDQDIIRMYFGIGMPSMPPNEIARRYGLGLERVRQLLKHALSRIRRRYSKELKGLL